MYLAEAKKPSEPKGEWDLLNDIDIPFPEHASEMGQR
jgi:hypothetical protein